VSGADVLWFLFSAGGVVSVLVVVALWVWFRPDSRAARRAVAVIAIFYLIASTFVVPQMVGNILRRPFHPLAASDVPAGNTAVVLLGSGSMTRTDWSDRPISVLDSIGAERTLEAARIYSLLHPLWVISSGGLIDPDDDENEPSGKTMKTALVALGVPEDRIIVESRSRTTREEATLVAGMLPALQIRSVVLVTSALHMRRSLAVFRSAGVEVIPAVARDWQPDEWLFRLLPTQAGLRESAQVAHEIAGMVYYRMRGWYR